ncbi:SPATA2 family protein [Megaselia abdita]
MTEYLTELLPEMWEEILQLHWKFLDAEENHTKLEAKKRFEECIGRFLLTVPNDRKFFLPETSMILKQSIMEMENFSAHKAMKGFESISQYANNLWTKPWRKEYRVIKMYSGYFHHEIKKNLVNAEEMFIAMGYKKTANEVLVLEEPICSDQVANVSRDCMTAYVECQIMKVLKTQISDSNLSATWLDILRARESVIGGTTLSMKALVSYLQKKDRKEKPSENIYATIKHGQVGTVNNMVSNCTKCVQPFQYMHTNGCAIHQGMQQQPLPPMQPPCNIHLNGYNRYAPYPFGAQQIPHSKSLEHYNNENGAQFHMPHRHSFDQPNHYETLRNNSHIYETPYDCVDGRHPYNSMMLQHQQQQHAYHSPGNRHPLTITNEYFNHPASPPPPPPKNLQDTYYFECNGYPQPPRKSNKEFNTCTQQKSYPPISAEQQFNEFSSSYKKQQQQQQSQPPQQHQQQPQNHNKAGVFRNRNFNSGSHEFMDVENSFNSMSLSQQSSKPKKQSNNKFWDNKYYPQQPSHATTTTSTSDSYEEMSNRRRTTTRSRIDEGVGSFENWDYVYQGLGNNNKHNGQGGTPHPQPAPPHQHHPVEENPKVEKINSSRVANRVSVPALNVKTWSCKFCTFLNEDKTRICAMCSKTKDFNPTESLTKPTCV